MAVLIEGFSVIVRNATLEEKYPGGAEGFYRDRPNNRFCSDDRLSQVGFMVQRDAELFVAQLAAKGLTPSRKNVAEDVVIVSESVGPLLPCDWLEHGRWGKAALAWLAGTKRGDLHAPPEWNADSGLQLMSVEEVEKQLEFVRTENNVDVFRDKATGKELYAGRTQSDSDSETSKHDGLYKEACDLIEGLILIGDRPPGPLAPSEQQRLAAAIPLFVEVARIKPGNWAAMWLLGKVYQRLADYEHSFEWFSRAHRINPDQPDVAREAAIAAMEVGLPDEAIRFCERAIEADPNEPGLRANLALALLFSGKPEEALTTANEALARNPADRITSQIVRIIREVLEGIRRCPHHVRDLQ